MVILKGKYALARVMLDEADLDQGVRDQIMTFLNHPAFKGAVIVIMPDCHVGTGSVIGFTMVVNDYVIPNIVGVDIGCGVIAYNMGLKRNELNLDDFDRMVRANVPLGFKRNTNTKHTEKYFQPVYFDLAKKIGVEELDWTRSIGTLGGGNHFIEVDADTEDNLWLLVHSGSRHFGLKVAEYWQTIAQELCARFFYEGDKDLAFLPLDMGGSGYLTDMMIAQQYAIANRLAICEEVIGSSFKPIPDQTFISSVHNYISAEDSIIRKGAISARKGEKCIIPFNMKEGVAICTGKGNKNYNFSAPHGAGRNFGRKEMKRKLASGEISVQGFQQEMEDAGIYTTSANADTIDESPLAYKDKDLILKNIEPTVSVDFFLKPVWVIKAGKEG